MSTEPKNVKEVASAFINQEIDTAIELDEWTEHHKARVQTLALAFELVTGLNIFSSKNEEFAIAIGKLSKSSGGSTIL